VGVLVSSVLLWLETIPSHYFGKNRNDNAQQNGRQEVRNDSQERISIPRINSHVTTRLKRNSNIQVRLNYRDKELSG